ncbi:MAG: BamA/TamA family outer membrane protein, partial [Flavobacteriales bacterium]|nr:BamA/TamA family outer membrane protein [Flavobacteriales bacterium]
MKTKIIITSLAILLTISSALSQTADSLKIKEGPKKGKVYFAPLPLLMSNPTFGFMYGVAASTSAYFGDPNTTRLSTSLGSISYTTMKQFMFTFKSNVYLENDSWILLGDMRYFNTSQPTFGLGTGHQSAKMADGYEYEAGFFSEPVPSGQMMEFQFIRFHETAFKQINGDFYIGAGYHMDYHYQIKDNLLNLDTVPPTITSHYLYNQQYGFDNEQYILSGISLNALYDSRDNAANTYKGRYALVTFRINPTWLGSSKNSTSLWLEYREYIALSKKAQPSHMLAIWMYGNFQTSGALPYLDLPALGWDQFGRSGRAYTQGRFRGESLVYSELEYRVHILGTKKNPDFMGAVAFVNATTANNPDTGIDVFEYMNLGYGVGLRFMMNKTSRTNVT